MRVRVSAVFEREGEILCMKYVYGGKEVFALPGRGDRWNLSGIAWSGASGKRIWSLSKSYQ